MLLICLLTVLSCYSQNIVELQRAYKNKSVTRLNKFFQGWQKKITPITNKDLSEMNDTIRQAYAAFTSFYQPFNIKALGGSEFGNKNYNKVHFLIIQNNINIRITNEKIYYTEAERDSFIVSTIKRSNMSDSVIQRLTKRTDGKLPDRTIQIFSPNKYYNERDTGKLVFKVKDFHPVINGKGRPPLYLTAKYDTLLNNFLGNTHSPLGKGNIMSPAKAEAESAKRQKFLEHFIKIWYGHWGGYWQLESYPTASEIIFDKDFSYAKINFQMIYEGGEAILKKDKGKWVLLSAKRTWIE
jgi:hypothetical protein